MSAWMALALVVILVGGLAILSRLHLLEIAVFFWIAFAAGIAVLAASGHAMTARWHLGPVTGWEFWRVLVFSPEILVFLFFMITDPKTIPRERLGRRLYAVGIALVAVLLIAPQTTEFATKVAVLGGARARLRGAAGRRGARAAARRLLGAGAGARRARSRSAERRRSRRSSCSRGSRRAPTRLRPAGPPSGPGSCRRSRSSSRRASPPSSTRRRRSGSPATSSPTSAPRPRRWRSATRSWPPRRQRARGSPRSGSRWTRPGARSPFPTTTSSAWS